MVEVRLAQPVLVRAIGLRTIEQLPLGIQYQAVRGGPLNQQVGLQTEPVLASVPYQREAVGLRSQRKRPRQLPCQMPGNKGFKYRLHREQQRWRAIVSCSSEWRLVLQDQSCPRQGFRVAAHAAIQPHPLKIQRWLFRHRHLGKHKTQLACQLLMRLRGRPSQCAPQRRMQQTVFRAIDRELVESRKEPIPAAQVLPQMRGHLNLAAQRKDIVLPRAVVTAQSALDDVLHRSQELANEHFQQGHARGHQLGAFGLDVAEPTQAAQHLDQQLPGLCITAVQRLADLGQHFDLKPVRCANHPDEAGHLHGTVSASLRQTQPRRFAHLGRTQGLRFQPTEHALGHRAQITSIGCARRRGHQRIEFVDRDARHARVRQVAV